MILTSTVIVSADGLDEQVIYNDDLANRLVTEYYTPGLLENYESGSIQTSAKPGQNIELDAKSAILIEQSTGNVLYEKQADEKLPLASITKIMSLILIMESIEQGKLTLDTNVVCSEHAASMGGSQIWLEPNEQMSVDHLLKAVVIGSANDATCALAEAVAGSEEVFVQLMNSKAKALGMKNTNFVNCSGLDADNHFSSARDIAIMAKELLKYDIIYTYSTVWMDTLRNGQTQLVNTNKLVRFYKGATGLKTGTTNDAGCCVAASAKRNGLHLIAVIMGAESSDKRFSSARKLLDMGFANYSFKEVKFKLNTNEIGVNNGTQMKLKLNQPDSQSFLIEKGKEGLIKAEYKLPDSIQAPIKKGDVIGRVTVTLNDKTLGEADIKAAQSIDEMTYINALLRLLKYTFRL